MLDTVKVPKDFEPIFLKAQEYASKYFKEKKEEPSKGTIEIFGERYVLIRAASMSVDFFDTVKNLYKEEGEEEALNVARNLLFDIAHAIGKADARNFHIKMNLKDPIEKLSAGPVHFAHSGWAFVDIFPESRPTPDEDFYLIYDHPFSFEADAWNKAGKRSDCPVCVMNAGYSAGWCEESFGIPLVTAEILCTAKGDDVCRFIMAHPSKIEGYIRAYLNKEPELAEQITKYEIPGFFKRKQIEDELRESEAQYRSIFNSTTDSFLIFDQDGNIVEGNPQACKMCGYPYKELIKLSGKDIVHPDYYHLFEQFKRDIQETGEFHAESVEVRKDGTLFNIEVRGAEFNYKGKKHLLAVVRDITERKRAEEELRESEERYRTLFKSAGEGILIADIETWQFKYANPAICAMLGYAEEKLKELSVSDIHPKDKFEHTISEFEAKRRGEKALAPDIPCLKKDGTVIYADITTSRALIDGRECNIGFFSDVTERKKMGAVLQESEGKYRLLADNTLDCVWQIGLDFKFTYVNPSVLQMFGFTQEEWIGTSLSDHCSPGDMDFMSRLAKEGLKKGPEASGVTFETRILHKNGETIDVEIVANVLLDEDKNPVGFQGTTRDITERKRMEYDLENSKQHFQMLFNHMVDPVVIIDSEGVFLAVTDRVEEITGFKREELLGRNFLQLEIVTDESKALMAENLAKRTKGQDVAPYEVEVLLKDRRKMPYEVNAALITYMGQIADMVVFRDISDRKRAEEELGKRTEDLERFNKLAVDRELVMIELKKEVNRLYEQQGEKPHYDLSFLDETVLKK